MSDIIFNKELKFLMTPERRFRELMTSNEIKIDSNRYPNRIFHLKDNKILYMYNTSTKVFAISDELAWSIFKLEYNFDGYHVCGYIRLFAYDIYGFKEVEPVQLRLGASLLIEEHFNKK